MSPLSPVPAHVATPPFVKAEPLTSVLPEQAVAGAADASIESEYPDYASLKAALLAERAAARELDDSLETRFMQLRAREAALSSAGPSGGQGQTEALDAARREADELSQALEKMRADKAGMEQAVESSNTDMLAANKALYDILRELQDFKRASADAITQRDTQISTMEGQLKATLAERVQSEQVKAQQIQNIEALAKQLQMQVAEVMSLRQKLSDAEARITPDSKLQDYLATVKELMELNTIQEGTIGTLQEQNAQLEAQLIQLKAQLEIARAKARESASTDSSRKEYRPSSSRTRGRSRSPTPPRRTSTHTHTHTSTRARTRSRTRSPHRDRDRDRDSPRKRRRISPSPVRARSPVRSRTNTNTTTRPRTRTRTPPPIPPRTRTRTPPPRYSAPPPPEPAPDPAAERSAVCAYMLRFISPNKPRPKSFLHHFAVGKVDDPQRIFDLQRGNSRRTALYLPHRTFWCDNEHFHAIAYAPTLEYAGGSTTDGGSASRWKPHRHLADFAASRQEVDLFVAQGDHVFYAGIYVVRNFALGTSATGAGGVAPLSVVEGYTPGAVLRHGDVSVQAIYDAMSLPSSGAHSFSSAEKRRQEALVREAYPDKRGSATSTSTQPQVRVDCYGLQYMNWDANLARTLSQAALQTHDQNAGAAGSWAPGLGTGTGTGKWSSGAWQGYGQEWERQQDSGWGTRY
ncbi:hypothetical protein HMN09_00845300 [Mycena chlorophos]|uniref:Uncharacterized protein n=1 Tax=Mycena chlorophos TaxID=658473 RepID=A0A8H6SS07_MYCCL|nr:hypothetical protein HMN09_00845300 [Mycena chlorophos]